ncbi:chemotaxis protein CheB [Clostridium lacusfryxellense]|uniref:chemotaxis protein CheB n=1 Tax=Clostridium lacusfryxellense TaxID=205328 RepID=UPI001C0C6743|nr:chemotaxis protein CheB [Clostridium lacusfryxellense]MBU3112900.1 chemotaxis protein CheB [Clostridium lacusfryxellense]
MKIKALVIGASAGGLDAISTVISGLKEDFSVPILIVQHIGRHPSKYMVKYLNDICNINVYEAEEKEKVLPGNAYIAPPNYHLLVEGDETLSLTVEPKVNYARPSIDVLFDSAANVYGNGLIGIILTGANRDGSNGLKRIKELGGITIVQDPRTATSNTMPMAAIALTKVDYVLKLSEISNKLNELVVDMNEPNR